MWIFADLPFTYAIRVLDVYLLEGYKVLYRFVTAAAFQQINKKLSPKYVISSAISVTLGKKQTYRQNNSINVFHNYSL